MKSSNKKIADQLKNHNEQEANKRMDVIASNGNTGKHYCKCGKCYKKN